MSLQLTVTICFQCGEILNEYLTPTAVVCRLSLHPFFHGEMFFRAMLFWSWVDRERASVGLNLV